MTSKERLDLNLSSTFIELALEISSTWSREGDRVLKHARGGDAPYRIRNRTGGPLLVWSDFDGSQHSKNSPTVKIAHGDTVDWRFDDWKTMREVVHLYITSSTTIELRISNFPLPGITA